MYLGISFGPMFAGKTTYLCDKDRMFSKKPEWKVVAVDPKINTRDEENDPCVVTHYGYRIPCIKVDRLMELEVLDGYVFLLNEGQWYPDLVEFIEAHWKKNIHVYISGLISDKDQKKFGNIVDVLHLASEIEPRYWYCQICGDKCTFTKCRKQTEKRDVPGGDDLYYTVCCKHLYSFMK